MLRELYVQNLAVIEDVRVELQPGFCAWTGETGAGKSLLLGALGLLLGERGTADLIRAAAEELKVVGRFEVRHPQARAEIEQLLETRLEDPELLLTRRLSRTGRSQAYVNDQPVAVATLRQIGEWLVDIHGQRESQSLLQPAYQLQLLDAYGHLDEPRQKYLDLANQIRNLRRKFVNLSAQRQQRQRELALIRFERDELDQARLEPGELADLLQERERLAHAQNLQNFAALGCAVLYDEEGSIVERLGKLHREAESWLKLDPGLDPLVRSLETLISDVREATSSLRQLERRWEADPERLEEVERRVSHLRRLEKKYGKTIDELIQYRLTLDEQEQKLQAQEDDLEVIERDLAQLWQKLRAAAEVLGKQRRKVAKKLVMEVQKELADLGMPDARIDAVLEPMLFGEDPAHSEVPAWGGETLELTLAANPGEPARPLRKVASGGELSRTMLALKTVLAGHDQLDTLIFDEIDANVGGRLGDVLGQKLAALGQNRQVICVTHLPQVASYARFHWTIRKKRRGTRTATTITPLVDEERLEELASMLRGESRGETTRQEALAMLQAARKCW